jgi:acetyl/propionyl-CoA carboxylase alpha subunit
VLRALNEMGIRSVAVYSEADAGAPYLEQAVLRPEPFRAGRVHTGLIPEVLGQTRK